MLGGMQLRAHGSRAPFRQLGKAHNCAQVCAAFRPGAQGRSRPTSRPRPPSAPDHNAACTLGRRPDTFNGDAARLFPQLPLPSPSPLPYNTTVQHSPDAAPSGPSVSTTITTAITTTTATTTGAGATTSTSPTSPTHPLDASPAAGTGPGPGSSAATTPGAAAAAVVAAWCGQLRELHLRATSLHRRLDSSLRDLDHLDLATAADQRTAERLSKVLSCYLSFQQHPPSLPPQQQQQQQKPPVADATAAPAARSIVDLRPLLARVEAAAAQLAAIGARHDADVYGPLRRFYFSADEPLLAISLRSEQYRRQLQAACEACGPDSPQVAALLEEVAAALSSHTVAAFLELDRRSSGAAFLELEPDRGSELASKEDEGATGAAAEAQCKEGHPRGERPGRGEVAAGGGGCASGTTTSSGKAKAGTLGGGGDGGYVGLGKEVGAARGVRSLEELAAEAAADYWCLQEARQELEVVGQCAEAAGIRLVELLRLADAAGPAADGRLLGSW